MHDGANWAVLAGILVLLGVAAYLLPTSIAASRRHPNTMAIAALNILLGWTLLGWVASLVWALTAVDRRPAPSANTVSPGVRTKPCPFCAEPILAAATKCRHCGSDLSPSIAESPKPPPPIEDARRKLSTRRKIFELAVGIFAAVAIVSCIGLVASMMVGSRSPAVQGENYSPSAPLNSTVQAASNVETSNPAADGARGAEVKPSFDCAKARSRAERLICQDRQLSSLDADLATLYADAKATASDQTDFQRETSAAWTDRERNCSDKQCLLAWYAARANVLVTHLSEGGGQRVAAIAPLGVKQNDPAVIVGTLRTGTFDNCCFDGNSKTQNYWSVHLVRPIVFSGPDENPGTMADVQLGGVQQGAPGADMTGRVVTVQCSSLFEGVTGHFAERAYCADAKIVPR